MTQPPATAGEFLDLLARGGGSVQIVDPPEEVRAAWRRFIHALRQEGQVSAGSHLLHRGRDSGDLTIELRRGKHPSRRYRPVRRSPLSVPTELRDLHPAIDALREVPGRLPKSPANRSRCLRILQALTEAAQAHGYVVRAGAGETLLVIVVRDRPYKIAIREETGARWPSGRLVLDIGGAGDGTSRWADYARRPLEQNLSGVLGAIGRRAATADAKQRKAAQQQEQEKQRVISSYRDEILREQIGAWRLAADIRRHCDELVEAGMSVDSGWLEWARTRANAIDPLADPPGVPDDPDPDEIGAARALPPSMASLSDRTPWHPNQRWYRR